MNKSLLSISILSTLLLFAITPSVFAEPIYNPENGHYYEYWSIPGGTTWDTSNFVMEIFEHNGMWGHLVTITSQSENDFVANLVPNDARVWIGLTDEDTEGVYKWVNGEPFSYSNWNTGEPNNNYNQDYVEFWGHNDRWYDDQNASDINSGFIIEYTPPSLPGVPIYNAHNGHYYEYKNIPPGTTWNSCSISAERFTHNGIRGHLATITSASENAFVTALLPHDSRAWIGLTDRNTEGDFKWINGESYNYTNWDTSQPDNHNNEEDYVEFIGSSGKWNDKSPHNGHTSACVIEYDTISHTPMYNPENGHYYRLIDSPSISWTDAHNMAENYVFNGLNGHLVTITSQSENDFVFGLVPDDSFIWIGLFDTDTQTLPVPNSDIVMVYEWVTGEPVNYTNWNGSLPNGFDYVVMNWPDGSWQDVENYDGFVDNYVIEYSD